MDNFQPAVEYVLKNEAGFVNDPIDPGGATNWGITAHMLSSYRGKEITTDDVKNLSHDEACAIYKQIFWNPLRLSELTSGVVATAILDIAVNRGPSHAVGYAQACAGLKPDGILGSGTLAGLNGLPDKTFLCRLIPSLVRGYAEICVHEPSQLKFLNGWINRAFRLMNFIEEM